MFHKDTHGKNTSSNKIAALTKSMNIYIWAIATVNQLFVRGLKLKLTFSKN